MKHLLASVALSLVLMFAISTSLLAQSRNIILTHEFDKDNNSISFYYEKNVPGSYTLVMNFTTLENAYDPFFHGLIDDSHGILFSLKPLDPKLPIKFSYKYSYILGRTKPTADTLFSYAMPFKSGTRTRVYYMPYLWKKYIDSTPPKNWCSMLFVFQHADTVCAVRKGIVVKIENENPPDSLFTEYHSKVNAIFIEHADGTIAHYVGIAQKGNFVQEGDWVVPGTPLGILGMYDAKKEYQLRFSIHHLIAEKNNLTEQQSFTKMSHYYEYLMPYFTTTEGTTQLTKKKMYTPILTDNNITQEMTKRELKKWLKTHPSTQIKK